ncbi:MAG: VWA domain-containing protein [Bacteroidota bacterium]
MAFRSQIQFVNESIHMIWVIYDRAESFNQQANLWVQTPLESPPHFVISDQIQGNTYLGELQGVCIKTEGNAQAGINLANLYEETRVWESRLPANIRNQSVQQVRSLWEIMQNLLDLAWQLENYTHQSGQEVDPKLAQGYQLLGEMSHHIERFEATKENLHDLILANQPPIPLGLTDLDLLVKECRTALMLTRNSQLGELSTQLASIDLSIEELNQGKSTRIQQLNRLGLYYDQGNIVYQHLIDYAQRINRLGNLLLQGNTVAPAYQAYPREYYYFNRRLLSLFNHHKYGTSAYYNRFLGFAQQPLIPIMEICPRFEVLLAPASASIPIREASATPTIQPINVDAPTNHLIFLMDVSASMRKPEKLRLLKSSLAQLLQNLRPQDLISIVTYSGKAQVVVNAVSAREDGYILDQLETLSATGGTNLSKGLKLAYEVAEDAYLFHGNNRILLATDGDFEFKSSQEKMIDQKADIPIYLSVLLFSKFETPVAREQLFRLAKAGTGNYRHATEGEAIHILMEEAEAFLD